MPFPDPHLVADTAAFARMERIKSRIDGLQEAAAAEAARRVSAMHGKEEM